jgi:uncharacterized membrane protein YeiH
MQFIDILHYAGTFAFAISGIRLAAAKKFDWFGAYVVGLVTAIGGGTMRDLFLNITPFWMEQPAFLIVTGVALVFVILFRKYLVHLRNTIFIFDAIGLGLFVIVGIDRSLNAGFPFWVAIVMGMITGTVGSITRDTLINEEPLIFRKDIYAIACVFGGLVFLLCSKLGFSKILVDTLTASSVILMRIVAVKYHISIPTMKEDEEWNNQDFLKNYKYSFQF